MHLQYRNVTTPVPQTHKVLLSAPFISSYDLPVSVEDYGIKEEDIRKPRVGKSLVTRDDAPWTPGVRSSASNRRIRNARNKHALYITSLRMSTPYSLCSIKPGSLRQLRSKGLSVKAAEWTCALTPFGTTISFNLEQPRNDHWPISLREEGNTSFSSLHQPLNASPPIFSTPSGMASI
jgi:hypothetical protein